MFSQVARIEEQQKAINSLKANLMDDLNARGILSTPECEKVLSVHKEVSISKTSTKRCQMNNPLQPVFAESS